ncbi:MAG: uroporphyrinogen-III synthase [Burkholderiales bacterium]|nr:uroporphyrinogen-III synthase [Burkholderiales bacterium]
MSAHRLAGHGFLILRPAGLGERLAHLIRAEGGQAILFPTIEILPPARSARLAALIARLHSFDWAVFVSPTAAREGVRTVIEHRAWPAGVRVAAVGRGTASMLAQSAREGAVLGPVLAPQGPGDSESLLALPEFQEVSGQNFVVFRGEAGRELLARTLAARGARVEYAECYRRSRPASDPDELIARWRAGEISAVCAASREALANLQHLLGAQGGVLARKAPVFVPHPRVAQAARDLGFERPITVTGSDADTVEGLAAFFAKV